MLGCRSNDTSTSWTKVDLARVLAEGIREAYSDLSTSTRTRRPSSVDEVKNKLRTLTLGQKSDNVVSLMANTFKALSDLADWKAAPNPNTPTQAPATEKKPEEPRKGRSTADRCAT